MEKHNIFLEYILNQQFLTSIIVVAISILLYSAINYIFSKSEDKLHLKVFTGKRSKTYLRLLRSVIRNLFIVITLLIILDIYGIDMNSALTGVGIMGVILGFALQDWFKDIIRGGSIISDNYFSVGDVIKYHDSLGKVLIIGLKSTRIQDLDNGNIITIANRNIEEVEIVSKIILIDVPMSYELPLSKSESIVDKIVDEVKEIENVEECTYTGVQGLNESSISYRLRVMCNPEYRPKVRKAVLRTILDVMEANGVNVPYNQLDIHNK